MKKTILGYSQFAILLLLGITFSSCKKDRVELPVGPTGTAGIYVLCEGAFGQTNNSSITYYNIATGISETDYFKKQNGIDLGTSANDLQQYGSKMYCVITGSNRAAKDSYVEVINIATGKSIKRINFYDENGGFLPRSIAFYKDKAYVSGYDGNITKIDTGSLEIENRLKVGGALEGVVVANGKLYAANSNQPLYPDPNNTSVSVVDLNSFIKVNDISVSFNPTKLAVGSNGDIYCVAMGQYAPAIAPALDKINSVNDTKIQTYSYDFASITISGDSGYTIGGYTDPTVKTFNVTSGTPGTAFISDGTVISSPYKLTVDALSKNVFVADATDYTGAGKFFCFGTDGKKKYEFTTGTVPQAAVFKYK